MAEAGGTGDSSTAAWIVVTAMATAAGVAALSGIVTIATVGRAGTGVIAAARNGSSGNSLQSIETQQKPPDSGGFFVFRFSGL